MRASNLLTYIEDHHSLATAVAEMSGEPSLAFDIEFDRDRYSYGFTLCLLQVASPTQCWIFDPLAGIDMQPVFRLFEDPSIEKLVHCPGEDLRLLHSLECYPKNLVDTEVYCKLLNYEQTSLSAMLLEHLGLAIDKKMQKSNWHQRPLTTAHVEYAASDVIHLHDLRRVLHEKAAAKNMLPWLAQEFHLLQTTIHRLDAKTDFLKPTDHQYMSPAQKHVLNSMFIWRDQKARALNKPAHQVMPEAVLRDFCSGRILMADLPETVGLHPSIKRGAGYAELRQRYHEIQLEVKTLGLNYQKPSRQLTPEQQAQADEERKWREAQKAKVFTPIQQALAGVYGENAVRYILSSSYVNHLLRGETTLSQLQPPYKQQLIKAAAQHLGMDIAGFW